MGCRKMSMCLVPHRLALNPGRTWACVWCHTDWLWILAAGTAAKSPSFPGLCVLISSRRMTVFSLRMKWQEWMYRKRTRVHTHMCKEPAWRWVRVNAAPVFLRSSILPGWGCGCEAGVFLKCSSSWTQTHTAAPASSAPTFPAWTESVPCSCGWALHPWQDLMPLGEAAGQSVPPLRAAWVSCTPARMQDVLVSTDTAVWVRPPTHLRLCVCWDLWSYVNSVHPRVTDSTKLTDIEHFRFLSISTKNFVWNVSSQAVSSETIWLR